MIKFDCSYKKERFRDIKEGTFFALADNCESLYIKIGSVNCLEPTPKGRYEFNYNCYNVSEKRLASIIESMGVIVCDVDIIAKPKI